MCGAASGGTLAVATALAGGEAADCEVHGPNRPLLKRRPSSQQGQPSSCHVLLVDDERLTRTVLSSLLLKCGYRGERCDGFRRCWGLQPPSDRSRKRRLCWPSQAAAPTHLLCVPEDQWQGMGRPCVVAARPNPLRSHMATASRLCPPTPPDPPVCLLWPCSLQSPVPAMAWRPCACCAAAPPTPFSWS